MYTATMLVMRSRGFFLVLAVSAAAYVPAFVYAVDPPAAFKGQDDLCVSENIVMRKGELDVKEGSKTSPKYKACELGVRSIANCGTVSFTAPATRDSPTGRPCPAISKCSANFQSTLEKCLRKMALESSDVVDLTDQSALRERLEELDLSTSADRAELTQVLQGMGVSDITATHVRENPDTAKDLALKILDGDKAGAAEAARELGLNDDLRSVRYLRPYERDDGATRYEEKDWRYIGGVTLGAAPVGRASGELERAAEVIKQKESGGRYGITTCTNVCVYGAYQVHQANVWKWSCEVGRCATPQQFLRDPELQDAVFKHKFGQYVSRSGSYTIASGMWHGGPGFNPNRSDALGTRTGAYMADFARKFGDPNFVPSTSSYALRDGGSPFSDASPFNSSSEGGYASSPSYQSAGYTQPAQQYPSQQPAPRPLPPISSQILPPTQGGSTQGGGSLPPAPIPPAATLIVQPKDIARGTPLSAIWSSVGMSLVSPCELFLQQGGVNSLLARANNGSKLIPTSATSTTGTWTFSLQCTPVANAQLVRQQASVTVR